MELLMEWKRYRTLVALDCVLCFFYILYGILFYVNLTDIAQLFVFGLFLIDFLILCILYYIGANVPRLINTSKKMQIAWRLMDLIIFFLLCANLSIKSFLLYIISFVVTILYILLQVYFYKHNKLYFKKK